MATTAGDLIRRARLYLNDGNSSADIWSDVNRINEAGLITILGDELRMVEAEMRILNQRFFGVSASINVTSGQAEVSLPTDFVDLILVERNYDDNWQAMTTPEPLEPILQLDQKNRFSPTTAPRAYTIWGNKILFAPTPSANRTGFATLWYIRRPEVPTTLSSTISIPDEYAELAALGTAIRARIKLDMKIDDLLRLREVVLSTLRRDAAIRNLQEPARMKAFAVMAKGEV